MSSGNSGYKCFHLEVASDLNYERVVSFKYSLRTRSGEEYTGVPRWHTGPLSEDNEVSVSFFIIFSPKSDSLATVIFSTS